MLPTLPLDLRPDQYLIVNGRVRPLVCGGEGEGAPAGAGAAADAGQGAGAATSPAGQTQAAPPAPDLGALQAALDHAQSTGQTAALQPLIDAAGVTDAAGLQEFITAARAAADANLSEVERRERAAADREAAAQRTIAEANARARNAIVRATLVELGAPGENVADLVPAITVADDADEAAIRTAADAFKAKFPALFAATPAGGAPSGVPGGAPPAGGGGNDQLAQARERGKQWRQDRTERTQTDPFANFRRVGA